MFTSIPSPDSVAQCLLPAFTQPTFQTQIEGLLGWGICLGKRNEYGVFQATQAETPCLYPHFSSSDLNRKASSAPRTIVLSFCQPRQIVIQPGSPSDLRPRKPPSFASSR